MKVDNNTLNFLSRGAEHAQGPRGANRGGESGFGVLFDSASKPVERNRQADAAGATAKAKSTDRPAKRESSDDKIEAVKPGEADAPERDVDETESSPTEANADASASDEQPDVGHASMQDKPAERNASGKSNSDADGEADKQTDKPVKAKVVATAQGPTSDRETVVQSKGEPTSDADKAAKVLEQLRQSSAPGQTQTSAKSSDEAAASPDTPPAPPVPQSAVEPPAAQATAAAATEPKANANPTPPPATNAQPTPTAPVNLTQPNVDAQTGDGQSSSSDARSGEGDGQPTHSANAPNKAAVNASAFQPVPAESSMTTQTTSTAEPANDPTVRLPGVTVQVGADGSISRPAALTQAATPTAGINGGVNATPLPEADASRVTDRVVKSLHTMAANQGGTVTLRLTPPDLGTLRIQVTMNGGSVNATFEASTAAVGRALESSAATLRQALEGQGLTVERINVQVNTSHGSNATAQQNAGDSPTDGRSRGMTDGGRQSQQDDNPSNPQQRQRSFSETLDLVA